MSLKNLGLKSGRGGGLQEFLAISLSLKDELFAFTATSINNEIGRSSPSKRTMDRPCSTIVLPWQNTVSSNGLPWFGSDITMVGYVKNIQM